MKIKSVAGAALCVATVIGFGSSAFAGEVTGSGKGGPDNNGIPGGIGKAHSACVYSGLEDHDGLEPVTPGVVQNWGHVENDPFITILEAPKGASEVYVRLNIPEEFGGPIETWIGCNPNVGGEE
jgi:hypothetical protein